jgi:CRP-like cAMP-binding protein
MADQGDLTSDSIYPVSTMRLFIQQLQRLGGLSRDARLALGQVNASILSLGARVDFSRSAKNSGTTCIVVSGFACRYAMLRNGKRQILAYLLPGDVCHLPQEGLEVGDHYFGTLTAVKLACVAEDVLVALAERFLALDRALLQLGAIYQGITRQWLLNLGSRSAPQRVAHLLCELFSRLAYVKLTTGMQCELPLRQTDLAEALGLTSVHICRTLSVLREERLALLTNRQLIIRDFVGLQILAGFKSDYLGVVAPVADRNDTAPAATVGIQGQRPAEDGSLSY